MGAEPGHLTAFSPNTVTRAAARHFEPQLASMKLGVSDIEAQNLEELQASLIKINDAIDNAAAFGTVRVKPDAGIRFWVIDQDRDRDATIEVGILPLLLERKSLILKRIAALQPQEQLNDIKDLVNSLVKDEGLRGELLDSIQQSGQRARIEADALEQEATQTEAQRERFMRLQVELQERRSAIWLSFLQRESVASIVGAILLLGLGIALIVAMFTHTSTSEVVANSFLLILGYFFGQASGRMLDARKGAGSEGPAA